MKYFAIVVFSVALCRLPSIIPLRFAILAEGFTLCHTLAAAAGDKALQRECQGSINAMVKEYERLSDRTGLGPDFRRTYVAGFRDAELTGGAGSGIMASDSGDILHAITRKSIDSVPKFTEFGSPEINEAVHKACVEILNDLINVPIGTEGTISLPLSKVTEYNTGTLVMKDLKDVGEHGAGGVRIIDLNEPYIAIHNHPSCGTFSLKDMDGFGRLPNCKGIVAIGNNGKSTYSLVKGDTYDSYGFSWLRAMKAIGQKTESAYFQEVSDYGVYYTTRTN